MFGIKYAGLFSNDDKLSKQIFDAGSKVEERFGECLFIKLR